MVSCKQQSLLSLTCLLLTVLPTEAWIPQRRIHNHAFTTGPLASQPQQQDDHVTGEQELGERYLLTSEQHTSSGKSTIYTGYRKCDQTGQPAGDAVAIKVSDNTDALTREIQNFQIVGDEFFVETHEYMEPADDVECDILHEGNGALVMELGAQDLKGYLDQNGPLQGEELRSVAGRCVECIETLHNNGMVWTEMKSENFILQECGTIKGIDLESAVPVSENPIDYSPKACPPEFALSYLCGKEPQMEMEFSFDIWSLGMVLYELAIGEHYFEGGDNIKVCMELKNSECVWLEAVPDPVLKDLIGHCLNFDKNARPTIQQVKEHPYFQ